jgi:hypothetical protein
MKHRTCDSAEVIWVHPLLDVARRLVLKQPERLNVACHLGVGPAAHKRRAVHCRQPVHLVQRLHHILHIHVAQHQAEAEPGKWCVLRW